MKNILNFISVVILTIFVCSCDEDFSPKSDYQEQYVLTCILRGDSSTQVATLSKLYEVDGYDPSTNTTDPAVLGASIHILSGQKYYIMRDSTIPRTGTSRYNTPIHFYYVDSLKPQLNEEFLIYAFLPSGKMLSSSAKTVESTKFYFLGSTATIPVTSNDYVFVKYYTISGQTNFTNTYFMPRLDIEYSKIENGVLKKYYKEVPQYYLESDGEYIPYYPKGSNREYYVFENDAVDRAMQEISGDDPNKEDYIINKAIFHLVIPDENLAAYYAANNTYDESFSIKLDAPQFSNIDGGFGIFGCFTETTYEISIGNAYIREFGYKPGQ